MTYDPSNATAHYYQWDAEGRVSKVDPSNNPPTWVFTYNALGHRVQFASPSMTEQHVFDPEGNWLGLANASSYTIVRNGDRPMLIDFPTESYLYHFNNLSSTSMVTGHTGSPTEDTAFYPWGDVWLNAGNGGYVFAGTQYYDITTTTALTQARHLGVNSGRFLSPDVFWKDTHVADPQSWNLYAYARNNPLRYTDPTGQNATVSSSCTTDSNNDTTCNVSVSASFAIYAQSGSGLTQDQMNSAASTLQSSIQNAWSGSFTQDGVSYNVSTSVSVSVVGSESDAMKSGAQNVIGISNGNASATADSYVQPKGLGAALFGGPDKGVWNINNLGDTAAHEFTHLLGVDDRTSGPVLSNTNMLNDPSVPHHATNSDFQWGLQEMTRSVGLNLGLKNSYNGTYGPLASPYHFSTTDNIGAPFMWWK